MTDEVTALGCGYAASRFPSSSSRRCSQMNSSPNPQPPPQPPNPQHPTPSAASDDEQKQAEAYVKEAILLIPNVLKLTYRLLRDPRVSSVDKAMLGGLLVYLISPIDLVPDFIPVLGELDDLVLVALVFNRLVARAGRDVVLEHWDGREDVIDFLATAIKHGARLLPPRIQRALLNWVGIKRYGLDEAKVIEVKHVGDDGKT
ncbi:MAG: DUF1232 domain-containing protein [Planctomycetes bacterium]|nr:DUF1232 domain-containing protein [Planctomycetota bacterium]